MDLATAWAELNKPLVFGDARQVEAVKYVSLIESIAHRCRQCRWCRGLGFTVSRKNGRAYTCGCLRREPPAIKKDVVVYCKIQIDDLLKGPMANGLNIWTGTNAAK